MHLLPSPDRHHRLAAQGWLELGNIREAETELVKIASNLQNHPDVLEIRWQIQAHRKQWEACCDLARAIIQADPDDPIGWIHRSYALHELQRTTEARDNSLAVVDRFPKDVILRYNLACYECQLNQPAAAMTWLRQALALAEDAENVKRMALGDPDLQPLWGEIAAL